ncbi:MAG: metal-sensing transcriptional repressor [Schwartzia sp.]|jgi:DNA-binding FrmR family transcriptional regulator|nr:metal-sensing transcriptional repressor [Schwartzia sp. (in: firmicutes)]
MVEKKKRTGVRGNADPVLHEEHVHVHEHGHTHVHTHTQTKAVLNRMARLIGHLQSVRRMVEEGRDCSEVLLQISAVDAALKNVGKIILKDHMEHCIVDAVQDNDREALARLEQAIDRFVR